MFMFIRRADRTLISEQLHKHGDFQQTLIDIYDKAIAEKCTDPESVVDLVDARTRATDEKTKYRKLASRFDRSVVR